MTDATPEQVGAGVDKRLARLRAGLKRRHAREARFKLYGQMAIGAAVVFLVILLGRIVEQGMHAIEIFARQPGLAAQRVRDVAEITRGQ